MCLTDKEKGDDRMKLIKPGEQKSNQGGEGVIQVKLGGSGRDRAQENMGNAEGA